MTGRNKLCKMVLSCFLVISLMISNLVTTTVAAPDNLTRTAAYTFAEGNIARDPTVNQYAGGRTGSAAYNNLYNAATDLPNEVGITVNARNSSQGENFHSIVLNMVNGTLNQNGWNTWSSSSGTNANPLYAVITWSQPYTIDSTRVQWWQDGSGTLPPASGTVEYWTGTAWAPVSNMKNPAGEPVTSIGVAMSNAWNGVTFDPVETNRLRLRLVKSASGTNGLSISEWEVFGVEDPAKAAIAWFKNNYNLKDLTEDVDLPGQAPNGFGLTYSSSDPNFFTSNGKVTRPTVGQPDANGTLLVRASLNTADPAEEEIPWSVLAYISDGVMLQRDLDAITLPSFVTEDISLRTTGAIYGSEITWVSSNPSVLSDTGAVSRPWFEEGDAVITLTATAMLNGETATKDFEIAVVKKDYILRPFDVRPVIVQLRGGQFELPELIPAYMSDNATRAVSVHWNDINWDGMKPGAWPYENAGSLVDHDYAVTLYALKGFAENTDMAALFNNFFDKSDKFSNENSKAILALYSEEGKLTKVFEGADANAVFEKFVGTELAEGKVYTAKAFIWNKDTLIPVTPSLDAADVDPILTVPAIRSEVDEETGIILTWNAVPGAAGYDLEIDGVITEDAESPYIITEATKPYMVAVRAKNDAQVSAWSKTVRTDFLLPEAEAFFEAVPFDLGNIELTDSEFKNNQDRMLSYLHTRQASPGTMLYNFRTVAGFSTTDPIYGQQSPPGWDAPSALLRGHATGHYLTSLSLAWKSTGDPEWKERLDYMVTELGKCQDALVGKTFTFENSNGENETRAYTPGYLGAYNEGQFIRLETDSRPANPPTWAAWYTQHKIVQGLIDCYKYGGNEQALEIAKKMGDFAYTRMSALTNEKRQAMWGVYSAGEQGGIGDAMAQLYYLTGDERYLTAAEWFNTERHYGIADGTDTFASMHANTIIPVITGFLTQSDAFRGLGDTAKGQRFNAIATRFWDRVTNHYTYIIGGTGMNGEYFSTADRVIQSIGTITSFGGNETCATGNLLRISRELFLRDPQAKYFDYYERAMINHILPSQEKTVPEDTTTLRVSYGRSLFPGKTMVPRADGTTSATWEHYGNAGSCCGGSGLEHHFRFAENVYYKTKDNSALYVNLYTPTVLTWPEKNMTITQTNNYLGGEGSSTFTIKGSGALDFRFRVPGWIQKGFKVLVNGVDQNVTALASTYVNVSRNWNDGDVITIEMPFSLRVEKELDGRNSTENTAVRSGAYAYGGIFYGPLLLCGLNDRTNWFELQLNSDNLEASVTPKSADDVETATADIPFAFTVKASASTDPSGDFTTTQDIDLVPFYMSNNSRYHVYFRMYEQIAD